MSKVYFAKQFYKTLMLEFKFTKDFTWNLNLKVWIVVILKSMLFEKFHCFKGSVKAYNSKMNKMSSLNISIANSTFKFHFFAIVMAYLSCFLFSIFFFTGSCQQGQGQGQGIWFVFLLITLNDQNFF